MRATGIPTGAQKALRYSNVALKGIFGIRSGWKGQGKASLGPRDRFLGANWSKDHSRMKFVGSIHNRVCRWL